MCIIRHLLCYHWLSENVKDFLVEPHDAIVGDAKREVALNMTAKESEGCPKKLPQTSPRKSLERS